jgi:protoporphyrinogen oxidase
VIVQTSASATARAGHLHILGGGPAGLATAYYAHRSGLRFGLHEAGAETGGNCRTLNIGECGFDTGAHRLHARDPGITAEFHALLGENLLAVDAPSRIVRGGKTFRFPPEPGDLLRHLSPRTSLRIFWELLTRKKPARRTEHFETLALSRYGKTLADLFLLGYTRKLWGRAPSALSSAVAGGRLDGLHPVGAIRKALGLGARNGDAHLDGRFLYPKLGIGSLFEAVEKTLPPGSVGTRRRVTGIRHAGGVITAITLHAEGEPETLAVDAGDNVVSTLPLPVFLRALDPAPPGEIMEIANKIKFRNLILCVLRLDLPRFSENASLYYPDPEIPFTRLYEPKNRSPFLAPPGQTCIVLEIPCDPTDAVWTAPDAAVLDQVLAALESTDAFERGTLIESAIHRIGHAYPVLETGIEGRIENLLDYCGRFSNLRLAGRNALFRYAHIHDMFRQGRDVVRSLGT